MRAKSYAILSLCKNCGRMVSLYRRRETGDEWGHWSDEGTCAHPEEGAKKFAFYFPEAIYEGSTALVFSERRGKR